MVKMMLNLLALEQGLQNINQQLDHLAGILPEFNHDPSISDLKDRLHSLERTLGETLSHWPQAGLDATG